MAGNICVKRCAGGFERCELYVVIIILFLFFAGEHGPPDDEKKKT
jgi:hypothetical protein